MHSVDGVCIKRSNIATCNSVIHVIPKILTPPTKSLYEAISTDDRLKTLTRAVDAAGLKPVLNSSDVSLTLFAPTDTAFAAVDSLDEVIANPQVRRWIKRQYYKLCLKKITLITSTRKYKTAWNVLECDSMLVNRHTVKQKDRQINKQGKK